MVLACAWMQLLKLRKTATSQGCSYEVLRGGRNASTTLGMWPAWRPGWSRWRGCWPCPRIEHVIQSGRELQDRGRRGPAVLRSDVMSALRPGLLGQDGVCLARVHDLPKHVQRATVHAEGDWERRGLLSFALQLSMLRAAAAPSGLMHREEAARGLVNVDYAVCADSVLVHEPAQLDEEPVRVGLLQSRAVELLQALGGLLVAQAHATQEWPRRTSCPSASSHSCTKLLIVTALRHRTSDTRMVYSLSRVTSARESKVFLSSGPARGALRFQRYGQSPWTSHKHAACTIAVPFSTGPTCRGTSRARWGRRGFCGVLPCCRWAPLQRVQ